MSDVAEKVAKAKKQVEELKKQVTKARGTAFYHCILPSLTFIIYRVEIERI